MAKISSESNFFSNIANMIPEGPLNKMVPLTEDHGGWGGGGGGGGGWWWCVCVCVCVWGGGGGGGGAGAGEWGLPLAHGPYNLVPERVPS